ncbi:MAG: hypothetical protein IIY52_09515 [Solobacterium sp.]|nr:hypothetical protein [Solobacterium sp.]
MPDFTYEITEELGVLSKSRSGWTREVNMVSWNGSVPKLDISDWAPDHEKMGKGISLNEKEIEKLKEILEGIE